jgi:hypothetical protein
MLVYDLRVSAAALLVTCGLLWVLCAVALQLMR